MKIIFNTNLDQYSGFHFPEKLTSVPRKGEKVYVQEKYKIIFQKQRLPIRLEVVDVGYFEDYVVCELWYNETDANIKKSNGVNLF